MNVRRLAAMSCLSLYLVYLASPVQAQGTGRFLTGPIGWTPTVAVRDAGIDSNVFDDPDEPIEDRIATFASSVDAQMTLAHFKVQGTGAAEYLYYQRLVRERALTTRFTMRVEAPTRRIVPFGTGAYARAKERQTPEIDVQSRYTTSAVGAGLSVFVMARGAIQLAGRREITAYDRGQVLRGADLAQRFNRDSDSAVVGFRFNITELTSITADASVARDRFTLKPEQNTSNLNWTAAIEFAPDAVIRGRAGIGYHVMEPRGAAAIAFRGLTANVDLSYVLLGRTRFNGRYFRDTAYSLEAPYYLLTTLGADVAQLIGGPFEILLRGNRQYSDYPENPGLRIPHRIDILDTIAAGVGVRMSDTSRATVTYELARRLTPVDGLRFDRRRVLTSFSYGF